MKKELKSKKNKVKKFLKELEELTKKYKIAIGGCGCCGSPYLIFLDKNEIDGNYKVNLEYFENLKFEIKN